MSDTSTVRLFISHATEDKLDFVEPLVTALKAEGYLTWYDKDDLKVGQSLAQAIGEGLNKSNYGIVVFSKKSLKKTWTKREIDGLLALEEESKCIILPIWKDVTKQDVCAVYPNFAGILGISAAAGIPEVVRQLGEAINFADRSARLSPLERLKTRLNVVAEVRSTNANSERLLSSSEGDTILRNVAKSSFDAIEAAVRELAVTDQEWKIYENQTNRGAVPRILILCPFDVIGELTLGPLRNDALDAELMFSVLWRTKDGYGHTVAKHNLHREDYKPFIVSNDTVKWLGKKRTIENANLPELFLTEVVNQVEKRGLEGKHK